MGDLEARLAGAVAMADSQRANLLVAQTNLEDAEAALRRTEALASGQSVSARELELAGTAVRRAQAQIAVAQAQLRGAEAELQAARNDYDKACICSPIDGVVLEVNANVGQSIASAALGQPLFTIAEDLSRLELRVEVDEADVGKVTPGDAASFDVEAWPDREFSGSIREIRFAPVISDGVVSYGAVLSVDNGDMSLRPGMTATADIVVAETTGALTVPNAALRFAPEGGDRGGFAESMLPDSSVETAGRRPAVWVLRDQVLTRVEVEVGLSDGQRTEITGDAIGEGDRVVVAAAER